MQFIDLKSQYKQIENEVKDRIHAVLAHGSYIMGPEVGELEEKLAEYVGIKHCITVSNGTDALLMAMMAFGIKPGDEVITSAFSFAAVAEMVCLMGAKPVFVDVDPRTYNLDPQQLEQAITPKTKMIIPIDLYGQCADYDTIEVIANKYNLPVVADAAQSFGATYKGKQACSLGAIACTSFYPSKPLGCYGDGGACFTQDDVLAARLRQIRDHGQSGRYEHDIVGLNGRLDTLQAAILLAKLPVFEQEITARARIAARFNQLLGSHVTVPFIESHNTSVYAQYTIQVNNREEVRKQLQQAGIPTAVHYPKPLHQQLAYQQAGNAMNELPSLPVIERLSNTVISLPMHPYLQETQIEAIAKAVIQAV
jgi:UDP-2-acetamido-2-deoxy-ribo-hexuluronate aminotransferase